MAIDFSKFDEKVDLDGLRHDIAEAESNGGDFKEVPHGNYEIKIQKLELGKSKKGDPMFICWMKILSGDYANSLIFMNQIVTQGFQIHIVDDFLRSLDSGVEVAFESYAQYADMIMDVAEAINGNLEYAVEYGENKGFNTFKITDVFEVE